MKKQHLRHLRHLRHRQLDAGAAGEGRGYREEAPRRRHVIGDQTIFIDPYPLRFECSQTLWFSGVAFLLTFFFLMRFLEMFICFKIVNNVPLATFDCKSIA